MLIINNKEIKFKRTLSEYLNLDIEIKTVDNIGYLNKLYQTNLNDKNLLTVLFLLKQYGNVVIKYIKKVDDFFFSKENFIKYYQFSIDNPGCKNVISIWKVIFGEEEANKRMSNLRKNVLTPFHIEYWKLKGFSEIECNEKIEDYKIKCGNKLEHYIIRHGEKEGLIRFKEFSEKSKHTLETFTEKYGIQYGEEKYKKYLLSKDSNSYEWALNKSKGDIELVEKLLKERKKSVVISFEKYVKKYGSIELAKEKIREINLSKDGSSFMFFLNKTGGDEKKAIKLYSESNLKKDSMSIKFFLKKTNGDLELAQKMQIKEIKKRNVSFFCASKESLRYFIPLYRYLRKNNIERKDIFFGVNGSYEYLLHNVERNLTYGYDFTIKTLNIIFEYHGEKFHPNIEKYTYQELKENKFGKYFNLDLDREIKKDLEKKELAIKNGFKYVALWSSDSDEINKNKIINALK